MTTVKLQAKCDMTISNERGTRTRFFCSSDEDFKVKAYQHCFNAWKRNRMRTVLLKELVAWLDKFDFNYSKGYYLGGLTIVRSDTYGTAS